MLVARARHLDQEHVVVDGVLDVELAGDLTVELTECVGDRGQRGRLARRRNRSQHPLGCGPHVVWRFRVDNPGQRLGARRGGQAGKDQAPVEPLRGGDQPGGLLTGIPLGLITICLGLAEARSERSLSPLGRLQITLGGLPGRLGLGEFSPGLLQRQVDSGVLGGEFAGRGVPCRPGLLGRLLGIVAAGCGLLGSAKLLSMPPCALSQPHELPAQLGALVLGPARRSHGTLQRPALSGQAEVRAGGLMGA